MAQICIYRRAYVSESARQRLSSDSNDIPLGAAALSVDLRLNMPFVKGVS